MTDASTYRAEIVARLRSATDDLAWMVRGLGPAEAHYSPDPQDWSAHEHLSHLRDMEQQVYLPLLRWATVPEMLDPLDYNRKAWHELRYDPEESVAAIMDDIRRMRDEELDIFRGMDDAVWTRYRTDTRWGPLTCQWIAEVIYRHVLDHMQNIMALSQDLHLAALQPAPSVAGGYPVGGVRRT